MQSRNVSICSSACVASVVSVRQFTRERTHMTLMRLTLNMRSKASMGMTSSKYRAFAASSSPSRRHVREKSSTPRGGTVNADESTRVDSSDLACDVDGRLAAHERLFKAYDDDPLFN